MENPFELLDERLRRVENILNDLRKEIRTQHYSENSDELLTIKQVANFLSLSVPTIYGYVSRKEIPVAKRGKRLYFSKQELLDWIKEGRKRTMKELENDALNNIRRKRFPPH